MIEVTNKVNVYEIDNRESDWQTSSIEVKSHWNSGSYVVLVVAGKSYTVVAKDIEASIKNARNAAKW